MLSTIKSIASLFIHTNMHLQNPPYDVTVHLIGQSQQILSGFLIISHTKLIVSFSSPCASFFTLHPVFFYQMGVVDRLHMRSAIKALAFAALAQGTEDKVIVVVDSGKVRCSLAEMGVVK